MYFELAADANTFPFTTARSIKPCCPRTITLLTALPTTTMLLTFTPGHLELVSDLSTAAFIAALTRFISRRGLNADVYSDEGTNFVGAK